jgi:hypothetical protein
MATLDQIRVRTQEADVARRPLPIPHVTVSATTSGAANTVFTASRLTEIRRLVVVNITGSAATLFLNSVPPAGTIGDSNAEMKGVSIAANTAADLTDFIQGLYIAGTVIRAYSGTGSALVLHGWAEEIL